MTIAVGLIASDGLVIAADRQETHGGFIKFDQGKVSAALTATTRDVKTPSRCCVLTGSGNGHHLDAVGDKLLRSIFKSEDKTDAEIDARFDGILKEFYAENILPFASYPDNERPDIQLLMGLDQPRNRLLVSEKNIFRQADTFVAVGIGSLIAYPLLTRFYKTFPDVRGAVLLAAYVISHVKDSVEGCGKATDIAGIINGEYFSVPRIETDALESAVRDYSATVEPELLRRLIGGSDEERKSATKAQARLKRAVNALTLCGRYSGQ